MTLFAQVRRAAATRLPSAPCGGPESPTPSVAAVATPSRWTPGAVPRATRPSSSLLPGTTSGPAIRPPGRRGWPPLPLLVPAKRVEWPERS